MAIGKKTKKLTSAEGFSLGDKNELRVSLGVLLGVKEAGSEKKNDQQELSAAGKQVAPDSSRESFIYKLEKVVLQRQTAGRSGKTVTAVILPKNAACDPGFLAKEMRKGLGCGSYVEEGKIILQGDISDRAEKWLKEKGVKIIIRGN